MCAGRGIRRRPACPAGCVIVKRGDGSTYTKLRVNERDTLGWLLDQLQAIEVGQAGRGGGARGHSHRTHPARCLGRRLASGA
jgi:hypothetical protein